MSRAYYAGVVALGDLPPDCVLVSVDGPTLYLLAPSDPHPALEALGAQRLGSRASQLAIAAASRFCCTRVRRPTMPPRTETPAPRRRSTRAAVALAETPAVEHVELSVPICDVQPEDEDLGLPPTPRVVFAGDAPEDYL